MEKKFFNDDMPDISDLPTEEDIIVSNNGNDDKGNKIKRIYNLVLAVIGLLILGFALVQLFNSSLLKKENKNKTSPNEPVLSDPGSSTDPTNPDDVIPNDIKEKLEKYCSLAVENGNYVDELHNGEEDIYEMCSNNQCMTTVVGQDDITYYYKTCNDGTNLYKRMTRSDLNISLLFDLACNKLDEDGNFEMRDSNSSISCKNRVCDINYNSKSFHRTCEIKIPDTNNNEGSGSGEEKTHDTNQDILNSIDDNGNVIVIEN